MKGSIEMGNNNKNKYDEEFKANAVRLVTGGRTVAEVARDLGVSEPALRRWTNETKAPVNDSEQRIAELEVENKKLKKELADTKEVADILKKSLGIFART
jgi:transposase